MIDPGRFKWRLTLEAPIDTPDGAGGATRTWQTVAQIWGVLEPTSGTDRLVDQSLEEAITHRLILRRRTDLSTDSRFRLGARLFRLRAVHEPEPGYSLALLEEVKP